MSDALVTPASPPPTYLLFTLIIVLRFSGFFASLSIAFPILGLTDSWEILDPMFKCCACYDVHLYIWILYFVLNAASPSMLAALSLHCVPLEISPDPSPLLSLLCTFQTHPPESNASVFCCMQALDCTFISLAFFTVYLPNASSRKQCFGILLHAGPRPCRWKDRQQRRGGCNDGDRDGHPNA